MVMEMIMHANAISTRSAPHSTRGAADRSIGARLSLAVKVWRERAALEQATPEQLRDIGVSRGDADLEAARPLWDLPIGR